MMEKTCQFQFMHSQISFSSCMFTLVFDFEFCPMHGRNLSVVAVCMLHRGEREYKDFQKTHLCQRHVNVQKLSLKRTKSIYFGCKHMNQNWASHTESSTCMPSSAMLSSEIDSMLKFLYIFMTHFLDAIIGYLIGSAHSVHVLSSPACVCCFDDTYIFRAIAQIHRVCALG